MSLTSCIQIATENPRCLHPCTKLSGCRPPAEECPNLRFTAVAGPTHGNSGPHTYHAPFQWSETNLGDVPNFRTIDKFDFEPIMTDWTLDYAGSG